MTLSISIAETEAEIAACMALRWRVFVEEQGVPPEDELDGTDVGAVHVLARDTDGHVRAVARFHLMDGTAKIGRVCVDADARGKGHGAGMINYICSICGAERARLGAQVSAIPFYQRLGFVCVGEVYDDAGIPHRDMEKKLR